MTTESDVMDGVSFSKRASIRFWSLKRCESAFSLGRESPGRNFEPDAEIVWELEETPSDSDNEVRSCNNYIRL